jgi:RHS repeat-associated protein
VKASSAATAAVAAGTPNTPPPEPPSVGSSSVVTLEYQVPLSGSGVPQMSATEVAKWGQTDVPAEAMAVLPPDSPMGWPAKEYTRATITYLDGKDRVVNTSSPTGGVSTTEYNAYNDVTRSLSPDDRAAALSAGEKSAEVSKELDTENTYEEAGAEPGTELLSTLGPKHTIGLAGGTQAEGRMHTIYTYNEGAPSEGGPYRLVTTMTQGAEIAGKGESEVRTTTTSYSGQDNLGWKLRKPTSVTTDPSGLKLTHTTFYEPKTGEVTETRTPAAGAPGEEQSYFFNFQFGKKGREREEFEEPQGIAVNSVGDVYVLDTGANMVQEFEPNGHFIREFGHNTHKGIALEGESFATGKAGVWVVGGGSAEEYSEGERVIQSISGLSEAQGIAAGASGEVWIANTGANDLEEWKCNSELSCVKEKTFGTKGSGEEQFNAPQGIAIGAEGDIYVADTGNDRIDEYSWSKGSLKHIRNFGHEGTGSGQLKEPHQVTIDPTGHVWVADSGNNRIEEFGQTGTFIQVFGKSGSGEGEMKAPKGIGVDPSNGNAWVADTGNDRVQQWTPNGSGYGLGAPSAHDTQIVYYSAGTNAELAACGEHPEWANLQCQSQPAAQPEGALPKLPVTTYTYNLWDEPETTSSTSGSATRTTTQAYDSAGRVKSTTVASSVGSALPPTTDTYNPETGTLEKQSTTSEGTTKTITSVLNTLGQLASYTDAAEASTNYEYDVDGRLSKVNDGKGVETYTYSKTTGLPTELVNEYGTSKLVFTATYDSEGNLLSEGLPNGMSADYAYDAAGERTKLEYVKTTHCSERCVWLSDSEVPSIHGQWLEQASTLSHEVYQYDNAGRLTQVQDTPTGKGCMTRIYAYDKDTNRTALTTREPGSEGKCASEGGSEEKHTYDEADRLTDAGTSYNAFGDITALSGSDAGGKTSSEELASEYYVDNQLASQKQGEQTLGYKLDPAGRTLETIGTGAKTFNRTSHYAGVGEEPAWTANTGGEWIRNIPGIGGSLTAVQNDGETPVLQLANLHGDLIATAYLSETATELASKADTSEYGVPTTSLPPKYSWLGALEIPTELPSGVMGMGARSYVPQLGRFLQPDPRPGGSANAYSYTFGDPVNTSDPSGESTLQELVAGHAAGVAAEYQAKEEAEIAARRAAEEAAARVAAESAARQAYWAASFAAGPQYAASELEWGEEWYWEEEGGYGWEYASDHQGAKEGHEQVRIESAVLYQPLLEAGSGGPSEHRQSEDGGATHEASGDGCGDGGYCGGHWVRRSEKGHRQGEPIGGDGWEPFNAFCATFWPVPYVGVGCAAGGSIEFYTKG